MRNLYGTRSIVPNNYFFTFDKIYTEAIPSNQDDGVLIGRTVFYEPNKTVYLKTATGYLEIAKLDNEERLIRNEGMVLLPEHGVASINYLSGDSATYNGNGVYILNYNDLITNLENTDYIQLTNKSVYDSDIIYCYKRDEEYKQAICAGNYTSDDFKAYYYQNEEYFYPISISDSKNFKNIDNLYTSTGNNDKNKYYYRCDYLKTSLNDELITKFSLIAEEYFVEDTDGNYIKKKDLTDELKQEKLESYKYYLEENNIFTNTKSLQDLTIYTNASQFEAIEDTSSLPEEIRYKKIDTKYYRIDDTKGTIKSTEIFLNDKNSNVSPVLDFPILVNSQEKFESVKSELYVLALDDSNPIDSWPSIRGIPKEKYLENSVFLLEQRSNKIITNITTKDDIEAYERQEDLPASVPNLWRYDLDNSGKISKTTPMLNTKDNWHLLYAAGTSAVAGIPKKINVELYQILTDITNITKSDENEIRNKLYHNNKTFIRKGTRQYVRVLESTSLDTTTIYYEYVPGNRHGLRQISGQPNLSNTAIYTINKKYTPLWTDWEDITEQYTGYIGDLDPNTVGFMSPADTESQEEYVFARLPYNKHTQYYIKNDQGNYIATTINQITFDNSFKTEDDNGTLSWNDKSSIYYVKANANRGNLNNSNTLVEATNALDEIIGSKTRLDGTQVNQITQGSLSKALEKDYRPYSIPENDIMDTLVHHDADIGAIENLKAGLDEGNNTNNLNFTTVKEPIDENELQVNDIQSIKDALIILDNLIGARRRLDDETLATEDKTLIDSKADFDDNRPVNIPENNIIDSIIHHDADIGKIETLSNENDTYNLTFTKQNEQPDNINSSNNATVQVRSLTDAITKLDNMIGYISRLGSKDRALVNSTGHANKKITGTGETDDRRIYDIPETNIIDTIVHHDADIGFIEDFNAISMQDGSIRANNNNITFTNSGKFINIERDEIDKLLTTAQVNSLTEAIYTLDKIIGPIAGFNYTTVNTQHNDNGYDISNDQEDNRTINIPEDNIIYAIGHNDADIGAIEDLKAGQEENNNTHNLNFVKTGKSSNLDNENNKISDVNSLTEAIIKEDNMVGYIGRLGQSKKNVSETDGTQGVTGTGNEGDIRPYSIPETTVIDTLVHHDADIGAIELLNGANIKFTKTTKTKDQKESHHEIHSLTDAITILDKIIGNYDNIENSDKSNLESYHADLVTAINALDNILGKFKLTENLNASDANTFIEAIQKLDTVLGKFNIEGTKNLKDITTFISAIQKLDILLGTINKETIGSDSVSDQIQSINSSILTINAALDTYQINDIMEYIKNLAENVDVLDVTIHNMMNEQSLMEWGTF